MLNVLTLPALVALIGFPGFGFKKPAAPAPSDTLPPPWKSASRLALEDVFVLGSLPRIGPTTGRPGVRLSYDPRRLEVSVDPDSGEISTSAELGDVPLGQSTRLPLTQYSREMARLSFQRQWRERSRQMVNSLGVSTQQANTPGLQFKLPSPLPKRVQSWLGPGGPAINVSGSENIRISGTSNWTNRQIGLLGQRRSLFPSLDMQQDLDIKLEGQLSDRIKVNLLQNSANQIPLANRIAINYRGDEDDVVQALDLGNTNLTLPGTQYVSYSGKNEGLFGAKLATRVGPLDWTVLASKQEGRSERASYGGGSSHQTPTLFDVDWVRGQYFLLYDPDRVARAAALHAPVPFGALEIADSSLRVYVDDNLSSNNATGTVQARAWVDLGGLNGSPRDTSLTGMYTLKNPGADQDYEILQVYGPYYKVLRLRQPVSGEQRLAVWYRARPAGSTGPFDIQVGGDVDADGMLRLKLLRAPASVLTANSTDATIALYDTTNAFDVVRELEMKNFYNLGGTRIDPKTFKLNVRKGVNQPYRYQNEAHTPPIPYVEILGLDNLDQSGGTPVPGHDGLVDGTAVVDQDRVSYNVFVDYDNGILFLPDPRPFAPRLQGPTANGFDRVISANLSRRDSLVATDPEAPDQANSLAYDKYVPNRNQDALYYMDVDFTAAGAGGEINLGRGNVVEGSDVVTVNGQQWQRDRDYRIDYDLGRITLIKQLGPSDNLNVDYSYAPLFAQAAKTLLGSAFRLEGRDKSFGGAFLYESQGAQDLRPRLGEEPSRSLIADLNTDWTFHPSWVTRLADMLPGVRTTAPSDFRVQAEGGMSFPNPNTRNEVFIDDMEGVRDAISLTLDPGRWRWGSVPERAARIDSVFGTLHAVNPISYLELQQQHNAEVHWYNPTNAVKEWHLKPTLTQAEGADNTRTVLALSVPRRPLTANNPDTHPADFDTLWTSVTYPLDANGLDLSRSQFLELWVDDFNDFHGRSQVPRIRGRHVKLHIDIGRVSEDQMRAPDAPPNDTLDTEDRNIDGQLSVTDANNEDTGLDARMDASRVKGPQDTPEDPTRILDLTTAGPGDPSGDDFHNTDGNYKDELDSRRYRFINGTEDNKNVIPTPDTEDLNLNGQLDTHEDYFEYTIDLGDASSPYLVTDVLRDYVGLPTYKLVPEDDGWRRYRIPINDSLRVAFGSPNLTLTQHVRVWVEGLINVDPDPNSPTAADSLVITDGQPVERPLLMIGSLDIVGSRWQAATLPQRLQDAKTTATLNSVNTIDNAEIYTPPFDPGETRSGNQALQRREQSLSLEFTELQPGDTLEAYKTFSVDENYSRYGKLDWYVAGFEIPGYAPAQDTLWYFVRFASDEIGRNYYEYRQRVPASSAPREINWSRVSLDLTTLSNLKLNPDFPKLDPIQYQAPGLDGAVLVINGRPSFTRLRRISFGLINGDGVTARSWPSGQLWFDEIRATDVAKDVGRAQRVGVQGNMANLLQYNASYNSRDADFLSVGETRGLGSGSSQFNGGGTFQLHRFFEGTGIVLPVSFNYSRSSSKPRFTAGDDVVRSGALEDASETFSQSRTWNASYQRSWSERSNPLLRYTVGGLSANISKSWSDGRNPTGKDNRTNLSAGVGWNISPRKAWSIGLPSTKLRLFPLPERMYWNYALQKSEGRSFARTDTADVLINSIKGRTGTLDFGADTRPLDMIHHFFKATSNLTLPEPLRKTYGFVNLGRVTQWSQGLDASYTLQRGDWLRPRLSWNAGYTQNNGPELSQNLGIAAMNNNQSARLSWDLPFDRLGARAIGGQPRAVTPVRPDTSGGRPDSAATRRRSRPSFDIKGLLRRLGTLSTDASVSKNSSFSRVSGKPSLPYMLGLTSSPGLAQDELLIGNQSSNGLQWNTSARSRIDVGFGAALSARAQLTSQQRELNALRTRTTSTTFPDFDVDYGRVPSVIKLNMLLTNPRLRSAYSRSRSDNFQGGARITQSTSSDFNPLISVTGDLKNGTHTELNIKHRSTEQVNLQLATTTTTDANTDVNLNVSRSYTRGQKVVLLGRETTVNTSISLGLSAAYSRRKGETVTAGGRFPSNVTNEDRLSVRGTGSYGFSSNVTGNAALGFLQTDNYQLDTVNRSITVEVRATFTF